ncbi:hypothetical protein HDU83_000002 [Entophlyctis luteolus]|nr:hypothetical protein HDU83_000002 [Entophlyctis luteolus]
MKLVRAIPQTDERTVSDLAKRTFAATFGHLYQPEDLQHHLDTKYTLEETNRQLQDEETYLLYTTDDASRPPIGFCQLRPHAPHSLLPPAEPGCEDADWELHRFYITVEAQGTGAGKFMMDFAMQRLRDAGARRVWLSVFSGNIRARNFYEKAGIQLSSS